MRFLVAFLFLAGIAAPEMRHPKLSPSWVTLSPGGMQKFQVQSAAVANVSDWSVNGVRGGSTQSGTIGEDGVYRAPSGIAALEVSIGAKLRGAPDRWLYATVVIGRSPSYSLVRFWGERGTGPGQMQRPHGIALDREGNVLVTDRGNSHVSRFTPEGRYLGAIGMGPGSDSGQFRAPRDAKADDQGRIYVVDGDNNRIQIFTPEGKFIRAFGRKGSGPAEMLGAHAVSLGAGGRLYVADDDNHRLAVFAHDGAPLALWDNQRDEARAWYKPHGVAVDPNRDVFACNFYLPCFKFSADGELLFTFAPPMPDFGPMIFHSLATDRWGNVYAVARDREDVHTIRKFNNTGTLNASWSARGGKRIFECLAVDVAGRVYVTVSDADRPGVEVYEPER